MWIAELDGRRRVEEVHAAAVPGLAPFPVPAAGERRVLVERMGVLGRQQVPDPFRRRALDRRLGHALGRAGRVADVGEYGGDADVPAEVRGDDALARLGERVEQAGEDLPELGSQLVREVRVGHVEPGAGDVVEGHGAAPVRVAGGLEVAAGGVLDLLPGRGVGHEHAHHR